MGRFRVYFRRKVVKHLYVDINAKSREEAERCVSTGRFFNLDAVEDKIMTETANTRDEVEVMASEEINLELRC